jgi:hypothetical protein
VSVVTDIPFIDNLIKKSGVPATVNLGGATMIFNAISGSNLSPVTFRRKPYKYFIQGRMRRYFVHVVVEEAKRSVEEAPVRIPPQRPRRPKHSESNSPDSVRSPATDVRRQLKHTPAT